MMTRTKLAIGAGGAVLALSACGSVAATPGQTEHHASHISAHQNRAVTSATYVTDVVKAKQDLTRRPAQRAGGR
jgi:hypothetical protein